MRFGQLYFIYGFLAIIGLAVFYFWAFKAKRKTMERFAAKGLLKELLSSVDISRQKIRAVLFIAVFILSVMALMRPQWGFKWQDVKYNGLDILVALDTSKSMLAQDIKPSRLARAKLALGDFARNLSGDRIGLIAFAGTAFLQCPLTVDYEGFLGSLDSVDTNTIPRPGTSISGAIKEALRDFSGGLQKYNVLIIITDGEELEGDALAAAQDAKKQGVTIYCIGIGTAEGEIIPAEGGYLKDKQGNVVKTRLNENLLQKIALATGGTYLRATSAEFGLDLLYREKLSKMDKKESQTRRNKLYTERFQIFLFLAWILLIAECLVDDRLGKS
jgi:Ca-activated chloride channel family protein